MSLDFYRQGQLGEYLAGQPLWEIADTENDLPSPGSQAVVFAPWLLQDIADYRGTLQRWFDCLRPGGMLVVTVPHAFLFERQDGAPSRRRSHQRRLYTPRALIEEVEEALVPNSYRIRWLGDLDEDYDYQAASPTGQADVAAAIERIAPPAWGLAEDIVARAAPIDMFEPDHTRVERPAAVAAAERILALKLDHLGDFVMGIDALVRLRAAFPTAEITLVVASWNEDLARELGVADHLILFDAYPRHSGEEEPDIAGTRALFEERVPGRYDLAIDMRTNWDSRFLLRHVQAPIKAGLGLKAHFPFLDIFLPVDAHIDAFDTAWSEELGPERFHAQDYCTRSAYSIACLRAEPDRSEYAVIWGPYRPLSSGDYVFEPYLEIEPGRPGLLLCDIAIDTHRVTQQIVSGPGPIKLHFSNSREQAQFECRVFAVGGEDLPDYRFHGGRLSRRGAASALHQSEYLILLIELIALRLAGRTLVREDGP